MKIREPNEDTGAEGSRAGTESSYFMKLPQDEIHIWLVNDEVTQLELSAYESMLDQAERLRASRFHFPADRRRFVVGHGLLRETLSRYRYGHPASLQIARRCALCGGEDHGKPYLLLPTGEPAGVRFSVSYSGELIALAFCDAREIGIDVERTDSEVGWQEIANHMFSSTELRSLAALDGDSASAGRAFYKIWTRKEAVSKASGRGLTHLAGMDTSAWRYTGDGVFEVPQSHPEPRWVGKDLEPTGPHLAAVAVEGEMGACRFFMTRP